MTAAPTPDPQQSGIYRTPSDLDGVRRSLDAETRWVELSLRGVSDKSELMRVFAEAFRLPASFGANWDALADALQDGACLGAAGCVLHVTDSGMARVSEKDRTTLMEVLSLTADYWRGRGKAFIVLVDSATELPLWK